MELHSISNGLKRKKKVIKNTIIIVFLLIWMVQKQQVNPIPCPIGVTEFQINTFTTGEQNTPRVTSSKNQLLLVTWQSEYQNEPGYGIYAQFLNRTGKVGNEIRVNNETADSQMLPDAVVLENGDYVVVWQSLGQDGAGNGVYSQRFNSLGEKIGYEYRVNNYTVGSQYLPTITALKPNGYVIIWQSSGQDESDNGIFGQIFNNEAEKIGQEFAVNNYTLNSQHAPAVTALSNGGFVVVWASFEQDESNDGVVAQWFNSAGVKEGREFIVNNHTINSQTHPAITTLTNDHVVIVWQSEGQDGFTFGIFGQQFDEEGQKVHDEFQVNHVVEGEQTDASIATLSDSHFVVTWRSGSGQDGSNDGVFGQIFKSTTNERVGLEFQVNNETDGDQAAPSVSSLDNNEFIVTWNSFDGSTKGIFGRYFSLDCIKGKQVAIFPKALQVYATNTMEQVSTIPSINFTIPNHEDTPITIQYTLDEVVGQAELFVNDTQNVTLSNHNTQLTIKTYYSTMHKIKVSVLYRTILTRLPFSATLTSQHIEYATGLIPVNWAPRVNHTNQQVISAFTHESTKIYHQLVDPNPNHVLNYVALLDNKTLINPQTITDEYQVVFNNNTGMIIFTPFHHDIREYTLVITAIDPFERQGSQTQVFLAGFLYLTMTNINQNSLIVNLEAGSYTFKGKANSPNNLTNFNLEMTIEHPSINPLIIHSNANFTVLVNDSSTLQILVQQPHIYQFLQGGFTVHWPTVNATSMNYTLRLYDGFREKHFNFTQTFQIPEPQAISDTFFLFESTSKVTGNVLKNDIDPLNATLSVVRVHDLLVTTVIQTPEASLQMNPNGDFVFSLQTNKNSIKALNDQQNRTLTFSYEVIDQLNRTSKSFLSFVIQGVNNHPVLYTSSTLYKLYAGDMSTITVYMIDVDDTLDALSITFFEKTMLQTLTPEVGFTFIKSQRKLHINGSKLYQNFYDIRATLLDSHGASTSFNFQINIIKKLTTTIESDTTQLFDFNKFIIQSTASEISVTLFLDPTINKFRLPPHKPSTLIVSLTSGRLKVSGPKNEVNAWIKKLDFSNGHQYTIETDLDILIEDFVNPPFTKTIRILVPKNHPPVLSKELPLLSMSMLQPFVFSPFDYFLDVDNDTLFISFVSFYASSDSVVDELSWTSSSIFFYSMNVLNPTVFYFEFSDGVWVGQQNVTIQCIQHLSSSFPFLLFFLLTFSTMLLLCFVVSCSVLVCLMLYIKFLRKESFKVLPHDDKVAFTSVVFLESKSEQNVY